MVKIEKLLDSAEAVFTRNGHVQPVFLNQLLTRDELTTLQVTRGSVVYSVDESTLHTISAPAPAPAAATSTVQSQITDAVTQPSPVKPKIVYPNKKR